MNFSTDLPKVGTRILNAIQNQAKKNFETFQSDLADPTRIPERLQQQTKDFANVAADVFSDTPVGLKEPPYTVVAAAVDYEIRDYDSYMVAETSMSSMASIDDMAETGAAFNSLAAYLFGANKESKSMAMTTPVTTTLSGEMRFYLAEEGALPDPLEQDSSKSAYETGAISIREIPAARLAVRRFTGFCTDGEIKRQKDTLLSALELDGVALDVPHGQAVGHAVFQYNPPYTIPVMRRNEIAVCIVKEWENQGKEWVEGDAEKWEDPLIKTVNESMVSEVPVEENPINKTDDYLSSI
jgi:hypothetical protein